MKTLRVILVVLFSLFVIFLITMVTATLTSNMLLYPDFYQESLVDSGFYSLMERNILSLSNSSVSSLPSNAVRSVVDDLLVQILSYIRSDSDDLKLVVPVDDSEMRASLLKSIEELDECGPMDLNSSGQQRPCRPPGVSSEELLEHVIEEQNLTNGEGEVDLTEMVRLNEGGEARGALDSIRSVVSTFHVLFFVYLIALVVFSVLIFFLVPWAKVSLVLIAGIDLFFSSIFLFIPKVFLGVIGNSLSIESEIMHNLIGIILSKFFTRLALFGVVFLILGVLLIVGGVLLLYFFNSRNSEEKKDEGDGKDEVRYV